MGAPRLGVQPGLRGPRREPTGNVEWKLTNGIAESNNASIGRIRTNARGFHDPDAFITMIMLDRAGLAPNALDHPAA